MTDQVVPPAPPGPHTAQRQSGASPSAPTPAAAPPTDPQASRTGMLARVLVSGFFGSAIEFYDFLLYTAASSVVFPHVFFSNLAPLTATAASFATLAAGFAARPVGALICGSLGDRFGRKRVLVATMLVMGLSSALIGVLPGHDSIGDTSVLLLVILRVIGGLAVGGEWGGATALTVEHATGRRRGLSVALVATGAPAGSLLATGGLAAAAAGTGDNFLDWGWRIPFLFSAVLVAVGIWVRTSVQDADAFTRARSGKQLVKAPVAHILRHFWRPLTLVTLGVLSAFTVQGFIVTFALNYAVMHGTPASEGLLLVTLSSVAAVVVQIVAGFASDRYGRKQTMLFGAAATAVLAFPMFLALQTNTTWGVLVCFLLGHGLCQSVLVACVGSYIGETFPTRVRTTASGAGYQIAGTVGGFTPLIAATLFQATHSLVPIAGIMAAVGVVSVVAIAVSKSARGHDLPA